MIRQTPFKFTPPFFEKQKDLFLSSLYAKDFKQAESCYHQVVEKALSEPNFSENDEKHLRQIQLAYKTFQPEISKFCSSATAQDHNALKNLILDHVKKSSKKLSHIGYVAWKKSLDLNENQLKLLFKTAVTFQLSSGCSNYCRRCNEWALPKLRSHFTFEAARKILNKLADQENLDLSLYGASDPLDWEDKGKTLVDLLEYTDKWNIRPNYSLLTKIPKGRNSLLKDLISKQMNISVSMTARNKGKIEAVEKALGNKISKQHELEELLIPAGLDEDFCSIKPSITDAYGSEITPEGAFIIIPTFTSALNPFGHAKIPVSPETKFFPVKKTGREALLVDYFKPMQMFDLKSNSFFLTGLLDIQAESILLDNGSDELTPPGMRSIKEYFEIFEDKARQKRKQMIPSVMKRLKRKFLSEKSYKALSQGQKEVLHTHIKNYLDFCDKNKVLNSKIYAVSFFLDSISSYVKTNSARSRMIRFLLKKEKIQVIKKYKDITRGAEPDALLKNPEIDSFGIFRFYLFEILESNENDIIVDFLSRNPAVFDPVFKEFFKQTAFDQPDSVQKI